MGAFIKTLLTRVGATLRCCVIPANPGALLGAFVFVRSETSKQHLERRSGAAAPDLQLQRLHRCLQQELCCCILFYFDSVAAEFTSVPNPYVCAST